MKNWRKQSLEHPDQILWIQYENLKNNGQFELNRIASFLGYSTNNTPALTSSEQTSSAQLPSEQMQSNQSLLDAVLELGSFDRMKEQAKMQGGDCDCVARLLFISFISLCPCNAPLTPPSSTTTSLIYSFLYASSPLYPPRSHISPHPHVYPPPLLPPL